MVHRAPSASITEDAMSPGWPAEDWAALGGSSSTKVGLMADDEGDGDEGDEDDGWWSG